MPNEFHLKKWPAGFPETVSGSGSLMRNTTNIRRDLPRVIREYNITSIFDAPCGDRNWIKTINFENLCCEYFGGDVIPELSESDQVRPFDLRVDKFPDVDLWLCRDCLYHLSMSDIFQVIENAKKSNVKYFLITSHLSEHINDNRNRDITTGGYRCLVLEQHNYFGLGEPIARFFDCDINLKEEMCLFRNKN